ncbi:MAG: hypothetical protein O8C62_03610 [Candidatus Methanoperedens sp.]|nr:hypothetical protein [Candidatus Methanoperedens sp.]
MKLRKFTNHAIIWDMFSATGRPLERRTVASRTRTLAGGFGLVPHPLGGARNSYEHRVNYF